MPLETGTTISSLNASNPAATDGLGQADDHMRLIKSVLKTTFPNFAGVLSATEAQLDAVVSTMFAGTLHSFPKMRADIAFGGGSGITGKNFLECDGGQYLVADFPALGAYLGSTYGGNGTTTFNVPTLSDTGRFIRSRTGALAVGTTQANTYKNHAHTGSAAQVTGSITPSVNTYTPTGSITHSISAKTRGDVVIGVPAAGQTNVSGAVTASQSTGSDGSVIDITAGPTFNGSATACPWSFTFTGSAPNIGIDISTTGGTETRPEAFVAIIAIKT